MVVIKVLEKYKMHFREVMRSSLGFVSRLFSTLYRRDKIMPRHDLFRNLIQDIKSAFNPSRARPGAGQQT